MQGEQEIEGIQQAQGNNRAIVIPVKIGAIGIVKRLALALIEQRNSRPPMFFPRIEALLSAKPLCIKPSSMSMAIF